jgi:hypothetical protein
MVSTCKGLLPAGPEVVRSDHLPRMAGFLLSRLLLLLGTNACRLLDELRKPFPCLRIWRIGHLPRARTGFPCTSYRRFAGEHISLAALISPAEVRPSLEPKRPKDGRLCFVEEGIKFRAESPRFCGEYPR